MGFKPNKRTHSGNFGARVRATLEEEESRFLSLSPALS